MLLLGQNSPYQRLHRDEQWIGYCFITNFTSHILCLPGLYLLLYLSGVHRETLKSISLDINHFYIPFQRDLMLLMMFAILKFSRIPNDTHVLHFSVPCAAISPLWLRHYHASHSLPRCLLPHQYRTGRIVGHIDGRSIHPWKLEAKTLRIL